MTATGRPVSIGPSLGRILEVAHAGGSAVLLRGTHGIGKSEYLKAWALTRGLSFVPLDLSLLEATDLTGLPRIDLDRNRTVYAPPALLPSPSPTPSLLVIEELNRCDRSVRQPCLQLLTERRLNEYVLPDNCFLVASINPAGERYDVDELDPALMSRFVVLDVQADRDAWAAWAREHELFEPVVTFVKGRPDAFRAAPPRSWAKAAGMLAEARKQDLPEHEVLQLLSGVLPLAAALELLSPDDPDLSQLDGESMLRRPGDSVAIVEQLTRKSRVDALKMLRDRLLETMANGEQGALFAGKSRREAIDRLFRAFPADMQQGLRDAARRVKG